MTPDEKSRVRRDVEYEGFDYTFESYDFYEDIKDPEFHRLRAAYLQAKAALQSYIEEQPTRRAARTRCLRPECDYPEDHEGPCSPRLGTR